MKIGIDFRTVLSGKRTGVELYAINLLKHLLKIDQRNEYIFFNSARRDRSKLIAELGREIGFINNPRAKVVDLRISDLWLEISWRIFGWPKIDKLMGGVDVVFVPNVMMAPVSRGVKKVTTFHDLNFELFPKFFTLKSRLWFWLIRPRREALNSDRLIAVSDSTKRDLEEIYKIPNNKTKVVYNGVDKGFFDLEPQAKLDEVRGKHNLPAKFILYLGTLEPRKNLITLIEAFHKLQGGVDPQIKLVLAGGKGWYYDEIFKKVEELNLNDRVIFTGRFAEEDKRALYQLATVFVFPSWYEGFGLPALEAMASGAPVIVANNSSLPEVVGSAGLTFEAHDSGQLAVKIESVMGNAELRERMTREGRGRARNFTWDVSARATLAILEE